MKQRNKNRIIKYAHHENERRRLFRERNAERKAKTSICHEGKKLIIDGKENNATT